VLLATRPSSSRLPQCTLDTTLGRHNHEAAKRYGFVKPDDGSSDVFFHLDNFDGDEPAIDDRVAFLVEDDPRRQGRRRAKAVTPIQ
jgi:cold shock CspA family protein